ncbi:flagellar protein FliT [Cupriavidus basilensis]
MLERILAHDASIRQLVVPQMARLEALLGSSRRAAGAQSRLRCDCLKAFARQPALAPFPFLRPPSLFAAAGRRELRCPHGSTPLPLAS